MCIKVLTSQTRDFLGFPVKCVEELTSITILSQGLFIRVSCSASFYLATSFVQSAGFDFVSVGLLLTKCSEIIAALQDLVGDSLSLSVSLGDYIFLHRDKLQKHADVALFAAVSLALVWQKYKPRIVGINRMESAL